MADDMGEDEIETISTLRQVASRIDPVPEDVVFAAKASFTWRTIDAELAELSFDSLVDDDQLVGVRGGPGEAGDSRLLTFDAPRLTIEIELIAHGGGTRLVGQLVPTQGAQVSIEQRDPESTPGSGSTSTSVEADQVGRFNASDLSAGLTRLVVRVPGREAGIATPWFRI